MADRTVTAKLGLDVTNYVSNADKAAGATKRVTAEISAQGSAATAAATSAQKSAVRMADSVAQGAAAAGPAIEKGVERAAASASVAATAAGSKLGRNIASGLGQAVRGSLGGTAGTIAQATQGISGSEALSELSGLAGILAPVAGIVGAGALAWHLYANNEQEAIEREKAFAAALKADSGTFGGHTKGLIDATFTQAGLTTALVDGDVAQRAVVGSSSDLAAAQQQLTDRTNVGVGATVGAGRAANALFAQQLKLHGSLSATSAAFHDQSDAIAGSIPVASKYNSTIQRTAADLIDLDKAATDRVSAGYDAKAADEAARQTIKDLNAQQGASPKLIAATAAAVTKLGKEHKSSALDIRAAVEQVTAIGKASGASKTQIADAAAVVRDLGKKGTASAAEIADAVARVQALGSAHKLTAEQVAAALDSFKTAASGAADAVQGDAARAAAYRGEFESLRKGVAAGSPLAVALDAILAQLDAVYTDRQATDTLNLVNVYQDVNEAHGGRDRAAARTAAAAAAAGYDRAFVPIAPGKVTIGRPKAGSTGQSGSGRAFGGPVYGSGGPTSDDVPIWASNGEWVTRAASVSKYGPALFRAIDSGSYQPISPQLLEAAFARALATRPTHANQFTLVGGSPEQNARAVVKQMAREDRAYS